MTTVTPGDIKWKQREPFAPKDNWVQWLLLVPSNLVEKFEMAKRMRKHKRALRTAHFDSLFMAKKGDPNVELERFRADLAEHPLT